jgi:hypothetical protein
MLHKLILSVPFLGMLQINSIYISCNFLAQPVWLSWMKLWNKYIGTLWQFNLTLMLHFFFWNTLNSVGKVSPSLRTWYETSYHVHTDFGETQNLISSDSANEYHDKYVLPILVNNNHYLYYMLYKHIHSIHHEMKTIYNCYLEVNARLWM